MANDKPLEPSTREHGVWGYKSDAVSGFGESYDAQVARGDEGEESAAAGAGDQGGELSRTVRKELGAARIDAANLLVEVRGGEVTLYGTVRDGAEKEELERRARAVSGVNAVTNRVEVANFSAR